MSRHKWFRTHWNVSIRSLAEALRTATFSIDNSDGFILERVRDDYLEARYVEKITYQEVLRDPFGLEQTAPRTEYIQTLFRAASTDLGLELVDLKRGSNRLVSRLLELLEFKMSIAPLVVDVWKWAEHFEESSGLKVRSEMVQIGSVELEGGALARVIVKGPKEVRETARSFIGDRASSLEKLQIRLPNAGRVIFTNSASATIVVESPEEFLPFIRQALLRSHKAG